MALPCGCFCLPKPTFADCLIQPAAVGAAAISANPQPGSVRCSGFTDYAPTRWFTTGSHIFYPVASGPLLTDIWQSVVMSPATGKTYYDTLTITGKDVGEVTLVRTYTAHPDPDFPETITYTNQRHLDEHNPMASATDRNLKNPYQIKVELGDPRASGYETDYDPYTPWLGEIPCSITISPYRDRESTPMPGSDYTYASVSAEYTLELSGPYRTFYITDGGTPYGYVTTTPSVIDTRDVSLSFTEAFQRHPVVGGRFGEGGVPIWTIPSQLWSTSEINYTIVSESGNQLVDGFTPTVHPYKPGIDWLDDIPQPDISCFISAQFLVGLNRSIGKVDAYLSFYGSVFDGTSSALSSADILALRTDHDAAWFDSPLEVNPADTATTGIMNFYKSPNAFSVREGGEYKFRLIDISVKYLGPS